MDVIQRAELYQDLRALKNAPALSFPPPQNAKMQDLPPLSLLPMTKRAIRRHQRQRIIAKRYKMVARGAWYVKSAGHLGKNNTVCSCWMCGNPRKYLGLVTRQELLAKEALGFEVRF